MQLFYAPNITLPFYTLDEEESKHCVRVLRLTAGDTIHITDGAGNMHTAILTDANPKRCIVKVTDTVAEFEKRSYGLTIAAAPTKNIERFEWFLEKATEAGIDRVIPIECDHSERRTIKHDREERVITSAVKQSLKAYHPVLDHLTDVRKVITAPFAGHKLIAHCRAEYDREFIGKCISPGDNTLILIGPEGDFSKQEIELAMANGFTGISLGNSRLRTETAAVSAVMAAAFINGGK